MLRSPLLNAILPKIPQKKWNELSSLYTFFTLPTIGSPINFCFKQFHLIEYTTTRMPPDVFKAYLDFCYPEDLPDREMEIDRDRNNYWEETSTFLVYRNQEIVGCVQIVPRTPTQKLPVEYASIRKPDGSLTSFNLASLLPSNNVTEIYRCRRSFNLNRMEAINVLLMLYKALWAKVIQLGTLYTCISFDSAKNDLKSLYVKKIAFYDPDIALQFGSCPKKWSLLIKDWAEHEHSFATISKSHFYLQTWFRSSLKKKHLRLPKQQLKKPVIATIHTENTDSSVLYTTNVISSGSNRKIHRTSNTRKIRGVKPDTGLPHRKNDTTLTDI
jgi:hypothetical protein